MARHTLTSSAAEIYKDLTYVHDRVDNDPETKHLAPLVAQAREDVMARDEEWDTRNRQLGLINVDLRRIDEEMDNGVRSARDVVLDDVAHDRRAPKVVLMFARGISAIIRLPYAEEVVAVHVLADQCAKDTSAKVQEQAPILNALADRMSAGLTARQGAQIAEAATFAQLQVAKTNAVDTIGRTRRDLQNLFPHDRDRVREFFRVVNHHKGSEGDSAGETPPPSA